MWDNCNARRISYFCSERGNNLKHIIICRSTKTKMANAMVFKRTFLNIQTFMLYLDLKCRQSQNKSIWGFNNIETIILLKWIINMTLFWNEFFYFCSKCVFICNFADFHSAVMTINWIPKLISVEVRNKLSRNHLSQEC